MAEIKKQIKSNIAVSVLYQLTAAVCSLILQKYILQTFGSDVNGILQSVSQLLNYTVLMDCGVGGLITASFINRLQTATLSMYPTYSTMQKDFFNKISYVYMVLVVALALTVKLFMHTDFDFGYMHFGYNTWGQLLLFLLLRYGSQITAARRPKNTRYSGHTKHNPRVKYDFMHHRNEARCRHTHR